MTTTPTDEPRDRARPGALPQSWQAEPPSLGLASTNDGPDSELVTCASPLSVSGVWFFDWSLLPATFADGSPIPTELHREGAQGHVSREAITSLVIEAGFQINI